MKYVQDCCCPIGPAAGHDGDFCRARLFDNGQISCFGCATVYPKMSARMLRVWRAIVASGFNSPTVELGSTIQRGTPAYDASCLCGYDPALSDRVVANFLGDRKQAVHLEYFQSDEAEIDNPHDSFGRKLTADELAITPDQIKVCVDKLEAEGFRVRHFQTENGLRIVMMSGRPVGTMGYVIGVTVELTQR